MSISFYLVLVLLFGLVALFIGWQTQRMKNRKRGATPNNLDASCNNVFGTSHQVVSPD